MPSRPNEPQPDLSKHRSRASLEEWLGEDQEYSHQLTMIVLRQEDGSRRVVQRCLLDTEGGVIGDRWALSAKRKKEEQVSVMSVPVADAIANGQSWELFGDNLFIDSDLSEKALPDRSRWRLGDAILELSSEPHVGCSKYKARFGGDALRFISCKEYKSLRMRGVYFFVVQSGKIEIGDVLQQI